jgi:hypothetical protein
MTSPFEDEGIPDVARDDDDTMEPPHDYPVAVEEFGTTAEEQRHGEPLELRLSRELPDVEPYPAERPGRLVAPDAGLGPDREKDLVATDVGADLGGLTAEEAAMHLEPER